MVLSSEDSLSESCHVAVDSFLSVELDFAGVDEDFVASLNSTANNNSFIILLAS
jgi:hypothetical protein